MLILGFLILRVTLIHKHIYIMKYPCMYLHWNSLTNCKTKKCLNAANIFFYDFKSCKLFRKIYNQYWQRLIFDFFCKFVQWFKSAIKIKCTLQIWQTPGKTDLNFSHLYNVQNTNLLGQGRYKVRAWEILKNFTNFDWLGTKISTFIVVKSGNLCLKIPPEASFYWKLVRIVIRSVKDIRKYGHIFQVWGFALATSTPPVFRVVLYHTEASGQTLLGGSVNIQ